MRKRERERRLTGYEMEKYTSWKRFGAYVRICYSFNFCLVLLSSTNQTLIFTPRSCVCLSLYMYTYDDNIPLPLFFLSCKFISSRLALCVAT